VERSAALDWDALDALDEAEEAEKAQIWRIIGGSDKGGILVRDGGDVSAAKMAERLATGSLVQEVELISERLHYVRLTGAGPSEGWVMTSLGSKPLAERVSSEDLTEEEAELVSQCGKEPSAKAGSQSEEAAEVSTEVPTTAAAVESAAETAETLAEKSVNQTSAVPEEQRAGSLDFEALEAEEAEAAEKEEEEEVKPVERTPLVVPWDRCPACKQAVDHGFKVPLLEDVVEMNEEFLAAYLNVEFQSELRALPEGPEGERGKNELIFYARAAVMQKWNFPSDTFGLQMLGEIWSLKEVRRHPQIAKANNKIMIALDPKLQKRQEEHEKQERLDAKKLSPEEKRAKRQQLEEKARQIKESVKKTAQATKKVLGSPVGYKVMRKGGTFMEPIPTSMFLGSETFDLGTTVYGFPASTLWVHVDTDKTPGDLNPDVQYWMLLKPLIDEEDDEGPNLAPCWSVLKPIHVTESSVRLEWPGLDALPEDYMAQYTIEWKCAADPPKRPLACSGQGLCPEPRMNLTGLPPDAEVQLRAKVRVNSSDTNGGEITLLGQWQKIQLTGGGGTGNDLEKQWQVLEPVVFVMPKPDPKQTAKDALAKHIKGTVVTGVCVEVDGFEWLLTRHEGEDAWILIDGKAVGPDRKWLVAFDRASGEGEGLYEVQGTVTLVYEPRDESAELYDLRKGMRFYAAPYLILRKKWLKLTEQTLPPPVNKEITFLDSAWLFLDNSVKRLRDGGPPERGVASKGGSRYKIDHGVVLVRQSPSLKARIVGSYLMGARVQGSEETSEGLQWLRCPTPDDPKKDCFLCIEGEPFGFEKQLALLVSTKGEVSEADLASWKAAVARPMPPRPLTVPWMAAYGGLPEPPYSVREELLPEKDDVGMNSQCTLLYITPAGGGSEQNFVTKRATVNDDLATKDTAEQEYRFYAEFIFPPPGESQPAPGEAVLLEGAIRVPRCQIVNYRSKPTVDAPEEEEEEEPEEIDEYSTVKKPTRQARNQYFLLLERFDAPDFDSPNPAAGLTREHSMAGVVALAKLHTAFARPERLAKLAWLPLTVFNIQMGVDQTQMDFTHSVEFERNFVKNEVTEGAYWAIQKMEMELIKVCQALARPPLTFCHGDYRPENLRFGTKTTPPEVATFDFGLSCRARGAYDLAYYIILSQPPYARRERETELIWRYLEALNGEPPSDWQMGEIFRELQLGSLAILALTLMTRLAARRAGFYKETRETQTRMLRWVSTAVQEWRSYELDIDSILYAEDPTPTPALTAQPEG